MPKIQQYKVTSKLFKKGEPAKGEDLTARVCRPQVDVGQSKIGRSIHICYNNRDEYRDNPQRIPEIL